MKANIFFVDNEGYSILITLSGYPISIKCLRREAGILVPEITGVPPRTSGSLSIIFIGGNFIDMIIYYYISNIFILIIDKCISADKITAGEKGNTEDGKNNAKSVIGIAEIGMVFIKPG